MNYPAFNADRQERASPPASASPSLRRPGRASGRRPRPAPSRSQGQVVKIAWIDPLSGLMAPVGNNQLKSWQFLAEKFNKNNPAGVKFEIVGIDNKLRPQESLNALKSAIDQGIRYVIQGNGSGGGAGAHRRDQQAQRAQPGQGSASTSTTPRSTPT